MKKWRIYGVVTGGKFLGTVEAKTKEEAIQKGWDLESCYVSVCHQCAHEVDDPDISEIDAEPGD